MRSIVTFGEILLASQLFFRFDLYNWQIFAVRHPPTIYKPVRSSYGLYGRWGACRQRGRVALL